MKKKGVVFLVHGTWGEPNNWHAIIKGTGRSAKMRAEYIFSEYEVVMIDWRTKAIFSKKKVAGLQEIFRQRGAKILADEIKKYHAQNPDYKFVAIGHSHGGNVIAMATAMLPDELEPDVVTLGTPIMGSKYTKAYKDMKNKKWLVIASMKDGIQIIGNALRALFVPGFRDQKNSDKFVRFKNVTHVGLLYSAKVWDTIEKEFKGS